MEYKELISVAGYGIETIGVFTLHLEIEGRWPWETAKQVNGK